MRARRLAAGDPVVLVDGSGNEGLGRLTRIDGRGAEVVVETVRCAPQDPIPPVGLLVAAVRPERLSWIVEKAVELSAASVTIVSSTRTQRFRASADLAQRLRRIARAAAEQAEQARWPEAEGPIPFAAAISRGAPGNRLLLDFEGAPFPSALAARPTLLLVGPEGGWSAEERAAAVAAGWTGAALPAGKLRAETAAVAGLVLARAALLRGSSA